MTVRTRTALSWHFLLKPCLVCTHACIICEPQFRFAGPHNYQPRVSLYFRRHVLRVFRLAGTRWCGGVKVFRCGGMKDKTARKIGGNAFKILCSCHPVHFWNMQELEESDGVQIDAQLFKQVTFCTCSSAPIVITPPAIKIGEWPIRCNQQVLYSKTREGFSHLDLRRKFKASIYNNFSLFAMLDVSRLTKIVQNHKTKQKTVNKHQRYRTWAF